MFPNLILKLRLAVNSDKFDYDDCGDERLLRHFLKGIFQFDFQAVNSGKFDCDDNELFGKSC